MAIAAIYVDDIVLTGDSISQMEDPTEHLNKVFSIKDLVLLHYFLRARDSSTS